MSVNSNSNKRIAKNSLFMTIRMLFVLFISLFTTREVLNTLGVENYGIYNVVCGFVSMFAFLNSSMTSATQRFYNFELGKNGKEGVRKVYNASMIIHLLIALVVVIITEFVGLWYVYNELVVPADRLNAAIWIFHFSLAALFLNIINVPYSAVIMSYERMDYYAVIGIWIFHFSLAALFLNIINVPYSAVIMSYERMDYYAVIGIVDAVLKLIIVYSLYFFNGDKLIIYGLLYFLVVLFDFLAYRIYAKHNFKELKMGLKVSKDFFKDILSFAGWNLFGAFAYMMREQGINLLLNAYFGPIVNAAKGVANQVNGALQGFSANILIPARPQIVQSYAREDYERSFKLMNSISKLSCIVFLLMALPVSLEIDFILHIWLGDNIPQYTASFIILMLATNTWGSLIAPISAIVHATGKMKFYQLLSTISNLLSVPLAFIFLLCCKDPNLVFWALFFTMLTNHIAGLISLKRLTSFSFRKYLKNVIFPLLPVILFSFLSAFVPYYFIEDEIIKFIVVLIISTLAIIFYSYLFCLNTSEKQFVIGFIKAKKIRL